MPPIFGGAGHHNHVGFCQPAHLYDEDFDDIGSDRDELEDLREMDEEDSVAGGGRSSTRSRLVPSFSTPDLLAPYVDHEVGWSFGSRGFRPGFTDTSQGVLMLNRGQDDKR